MTSDDHEEAQLALALARYEIIGRYLALDPPRGQRRQVLEQLAAKPWPWVGGDPIEVSAETLRVWIRRYRAEGLPGLMDKPRTKSGVGVLDDQQRELICTLKRDVPERSLDRIITIAEELALVAPGVLKRSTVHRVLQEQGISARAARVPDTQDLDRFEAAFPNDLWQSDLLTGVYLPDPDRPGKTRRADLYAFLDDHSRLVLDGRFSFRDNLPALELVFRRAVQKYGIPVKVYYDNGQVYRSQHMRFIVASLGSQRIVFTRKYRPMGHGKIEALNRLIRSAFLAEVKRSPIRTLDELNEAFRAWVDLQYNRTKHGETGEPPIERWRAGIARIRYAEEEQLRQAFLWREPRTPDKSGVLSLLGNRYQVGPKLARKRLQVRFDPEAMHEVEIWHGGKFAQRARPLQVSPWRRPSAKKDSSPDNSKPPAANWLGHLVDKHRVVVGTRELKSPAAHAAERRLQADRALLDVLADVLDPGVFDEPTIRAYLDRFGPFDPEHAALTLASLTASGERTDQHVTFYLDAIRDQQRGSQP
jgi:transposase InsO family protein